MRLDREYVDKLIIAHTHRIARRTQSFADATVRGPPTIIIKLITMKDRNYILGAAKNIPRGSKISVKTDLPTRLKEKRSELLKLAYTLRQRDTNTKTRIRESVQLCDVWLECLDSSKSEGWKKYQC